MPAKATELDNLRDGDRRQCPICNPSPRRDRVSADRLWQWSLAHPGHRPLHLT